jgi:hypothetical protein
MPLPCRLCASRLPWHDGAVQEDGAFGDDRPILPWRLIAGVFLHFIVPFYLIALIADVVLFGETGASVAAILGHVLRISPALIGGYAGIAALVSLAAALIDPLLRARRAGRRACDPRWGVERAERQLRGAIAQGKGLFGSQADATLARLGAAQWRYEDPRYRSLVRDLVDAIKASARAIESSPPARSAELVGMTSVTIERIAAAHRHLVEDGAGEDERKARILAGYVELRYGGSDFSSSAD